MGASWKTTQLPQLIREIVQREIPAGKALPGDEVDLVQAGFLDSMGWVGVLTGIEDLAQITDFGNPWPQNRPQSIRALIEAVVEGAKSLRARDEAATTERLESAAGPGAAVVGWGYALGGREIAAATAEAECGLPPGTLSAGAGFESFRYASEQEDQVSLAQKAAEAAFDAARVQADDVSVLAVTSTTFLALPSIGAALHTRLLLRESCAVFDLGGACVGLVNSMQAASAALSTRERGVALVVATEVHSRMLRPRGTPGEFRGLFGDGACAFVLRPAQAAGEEGLTIGKFTFGCSGGMASALEVKVGHQTDWEFRFHGEQLGRAAVERLARTVEQLERLSGRPRSEVDAFALHEPNPRLVRIFAQNARIPIEKVPLVSRTYGNLGSATCGVSLCVALDALAKRAPQPLIFLAAVGPGLLWGGTYLH